MGGSALGEAGEAERGKEGGWVKSLPCPSQWLPVFCAGLHPQLIFSKTVIHASQNCRISLSVSPTKVLVPRGQRLCLIYLFIPSI